VETVEKCHFSGELLQFALGANASDLNNFHLARCFPGLRINIMGYGICKFRDAKDSGAVLFGGSEWYSGHEKYLTGTTYLFGSRNGPLKEFKIGTYSYDFRFKIPPGIPSTVKCINGKINYRIEAFLEFEEFDFFTKQAFTIIRFEDLSIHANLRTQVTDEVTDSFCCWNFKTKPLIMTASLPFSGYVAKQTIQVTVKINNRCGFDVLQVSLKLMKIITCISQTPEVRTHMEVKTLTKSTCRGVKSGRIEEVTGQLTIPEFCQPSVERISSIVKVSYIIQVRANVMGFHRSPKVRLPVVVGTLPLKF